MLGLGLGLNRNRVSSGVVSLWILATGFWNDLNFWVDTDVWID